MSVVHILANGYSRSNTNYVNVTTQTNMYDPVSDTTDYATLQGRTRNSSTAYYAFINDFQFGSLPSGAIVNSFSVKIRCYRNSYQRTGTNFYLRLCYASSSGSVISNTTTSTNIGTDSGSSATVITIPTGSLTWDQIVDYGSQFAIEVPLAGSSGSYAPQIYVYGAEIEVDYSVPNPRTVTTSLTGSGTIDPSGTQTMYDGDEYNLIVTPTNASDTVTATKNGTAITLTQHTGGAQTESNVLGEYTLVSGSFNGSGATYFQGLVGKGYDNTQTTSNYYSGGNGTIAVFTYDVPFTDIPSGATITSLYMRVNGHAESTSQSSEYMCAQLISGNTDLSDELNFKSVGTSNSTQTVTANVTPTIAQLENLKVQCRLGYYGGAINGATVYLEYETSGVYYTYSTTISGDMTIAVTIGSVSPIAVTGVTVSPTTASLETGGTQQLTATVSPSNATDKTVSWSTSNSSVATVSSTGLVTAVGAGSATITVTTTDGHKTATCAVTVTAPTYIDYVPATTLVSGREYLIVNGNTGSVYMISNQSAGSGALAGVATTITNNKISITASVAANVAFTCELEDANNTDSTLLKNGSQYLYTDSSSRLRMYTWTSSAAGKHWHYKADGKNLLWFFKDGTNNTGYTDTSSTYKYYLNCSSGTFTDSYVSTTSLENTTTPAMYLFVKDDGTLEPKIFVKNSGSWTQYSKIYKKVNGSWVEQASSSWSTLFNTNTNYRKMT